MRLNIQASDVILVLLNFSLDIFLFIRHYFLGISRTSECHGTTGTPSGFLRPEDSEINILSICRIRRRVYNFVNQRRRNLHVHEVEPPSILALVEYQVESFKWFSFLFTFRILLHLCAARDRNCRVV